MPLPRHSLSKASQGRLPAQAPPVRGQSAVVHGLNAVCPDGQMPGAMRRFSAPAPGLSFICFASVVFRAHLEIALGMIAGGAHIGRGRPDDDMTAVSALPHLDLALGEDLRHLHIVQQGIRQRNGHSLYAEDL